MVHSVRGYHHFAAVSDQLSVLREIHNERPLIAAAGGGPARVTLTLPVINNARNVIFLVTGEGKRKILARVTGAGSSGLTASLVQPRSGPVWIFADAAASPGPDAKG